MKSVAVLLALVAVVFCGHPCNDGKNNVITVADINDAAMSIHLENVVAQTYLSNGQPSCEDGEAQLSLPGQLKLVSGTVRVSAATDLKSSGIAQVYLKKKSIIIGTICENGKSHNALIPDKDCNAPLCSLVGDNLCHMLSTPGTYDLSTIEKDLNISSTVTLPEIKGPVKSILKGLWQAGVGLVSNGKLVGDIKMPANEDYIYII